MEEEKDDQTKDFWLIQFQRLMDNKPQLLVDDVSQFFFFFLEKNHPISMSILINSFFFFFTL